MTEYLTFYDVSTDQNEWVKWIMDLCPKNANIPGIFSLLKMTYLNDLSAFYRKFIDNIKRYFLLFVNLSHDRSK